AGVDKAECRCIKNIFSRTNPPPLVAFRTASIGVSEQDAEDLAQILRELPENEALTMLEDVTARLLSEIFRTAPDRLDRNRSLQEMGMDSLMAVELQVVLGRQFGCDIPVMEVVTTGGIRDLARLVATRLGLMAGLVATAATRSKRKQWRHGRRFQRKFAGSTGT